MLRLTEFDDAGDTGWMLGAAADGDRDVPPPAGRARPGPTHAARTPLRTLGIAILPLLIPPVLLLLDDVTGGAAIPAGRRRRSA